MNETLSSDEEEQHHNNHSQVGPEAKVTPYLYLKEKKEYDQNFGGVNRQQIKQNVLENLSTSSLTNNISRHKGHVIIPLTKNISSNVPNVTEIQNYKAHEISASTLNTSSSSLNDDDESISTRHQKWSFTAAAMKNRGQSCQEWDKDTSSSEDEEDVNNFYENRKDFDVTANFNDNSCTKNHKQYYHSPDLIQEQWKPFAFVAENHRNNDLFCSPNTGKSIHDHMRKCFSIIMDNIL